MTPAFNRQGRSPNTSQVLVVFAQVDTGQCAIVGNESFLGKLEWPGLRPWRAAAGLYSLCLCPSECSLSRKFRNSRRFTERPQPPHREDAFLISVLDSSN